MQDIQQPFSAAPAYILKLLSNLGLIVTVVILVAFTVWLYFSLNPSVGTTQINPDVFVTAKNLTPNSVSSSPASPVRDSPEILLSPYYNRGSPSSVGSLSPGNESLVYGDTTLVSPQRRLHRRCL
uniref:Uncharacterized protein n=1 Tax=Glossina palpalis gambiensis TaxID=67801 RepID=A0A1B0BFA1_9MUSC